MRYVTRCRGGCLDRSGVPVVGREGPWAVRVPCGARQRLWWRCGAFDRDDGAMVVGGSALGLWSRTLPSRGAGS